jgi:ribosomal protein L11 methyltransferase
VNWLAVRVLPSGEHRAAALRALFDAGSRAVEEVGEELRTYLPLGTDPADLIHAVVAASPGARVETSETSIADWASAWRDGLSVQQVGALTVAPPWLAEGLDPATTIVVDPGMAFGTGDHATTRGVLRLLPSVVRRGDRVADVGAGSAVLAIAAAKLGASAVAAIEIDADAIGNAEYNVRANGVADRVAVLNGDAAVLLPLVAPVRVILANIVAPALLGLLETFAVALAPGGCVVVSGVSEEEGPEFSRAVEAGGWAVGDEDREERWWSAVIARR